MSAEQRELWQQLVQGGWLTYRSLCREVDQASTLSSADWRVLEVLTAAPQLRISDLSDRTQISLSTVSRQVTRFLERGLVARVDSSEVDVRQKDARQRWVKITDEGLAVLNPVLAARDRAVRTLVIDRLSEEKYRQLCTIFGELGAQLAD
ncbi:MAG: MarR family transcriptional regulator [Gordonia sp. (in: high G+C Gram-positive bacteria)]